MRVRLASLWALKKDDPQSTGQALLAYLATSVTATIIIPYRHSLLVHSISWLLLWSYCVYRFGWRQRGLKDGKRKAARAVGLLFAVSAICERVAGDQLAVASVRALLPALTFVLSYLASEISGNVPSSSMTSEPRGEVSGLWLPSSLRYLVALSCVAATNFTGGAYTSQQTTVLSVAAACIQAAALVLLSTTSGASGLDRRRKPSEILDKEMPKPEHWEIMTSVACTAALTCSAGCLFMEQLPSLNFARSSTSTDGTISFLWTIAPLLKTALAPLQDALGTSFLILLVLEFGSMRASIASLSTAIAAQVWLSPSILTVGQAILYSTIGTLYWTTVNTMSTGDLNNKSNAGHSTVVSCSLLLLATVWLLLSSLPALDRTVRFQPFQWQLTSTSDFSLPNNGRPARLTDRSRHPIELLGSEAQARFNKTISKQSRTLNDAVTEYHRRYRVHPPPNFDKWFEYAKQKGTVLVDEFDSVHHNLLPFWAFSPYTLRQRVQQAFGYDVNGLMTLMIRKGQITLMDGSREWLREALREMTADFIEHLPDMDIAFNIHDEPRVTVPHSELSRMVHHVNTVALPAALSHEAPRNVFSLKPSDMTDGKEYKRTTITRFNKFSHQPTWSHARLSCPPDSPARDYLEQAPDNLTAYALDDVGFIYNYTAFVDICNSPSLSNTHGFFDRPNMFIPTQDLVPVFSQSKLSSFQDIVYPSPWYWADKVKYDEKEDKPWSQKESKLYWRGSSTGGYSRYGGWRRHHRQRAVQHINALDGAQILRNHNIDGDGVPDWRTENAEKTDYAESFDVHFSDIGQCDEGDCHAQKEFFKVAKKEDQKAAWGYRYLLDMDGNAFSGRFIAFLKSNSLVYKMALFKEWHSDWLQPWLHYVPMSIRGDEWFAAVRYLAGEQEGKAMAEHMAGESREWANKVLRKEDMQVWLFRLLLEYGRLMDDDRDVIGYAGQ